MVQARQIVRGVRNIARSLGMSKSAAHRAIGRGDLAAWRSGRAWVMSPALAPIFAAAALSMRLAAGAPTHGLSPLPRLAGAQVGGHFGAAAAPGEGGVVLPPATPDRSSSRNKKTGGKGFWDPGGGADADG